MKNFQEVANWPGCFHAFLIENLLIGCVMIKQNFLCALVPTLLVAGGCASFTSNPLKKDVLTKPETVDLSDDDWKVKKVSYLAINLFEANKRNYIARKAINSDEYKTHSSAAGFGVGAQTITDAAVGQFGSQVGLNVGSSVFFGAQILDSIFDGRADYVSKMYIPHTAGANTLDEAKQYIFKKNMERVDAVANALGSEYECLLDCEPGNMFIKFKDIDPNKLPQGYIFKPSNIYAQIIYSEPVQVSPTDPINGVLGEKVDWMTSGYNSNFAMFYQLLELDKAGQPKFGETEKGVRTVLGSVYTLAKMHIGRDIAAIYNNTPYMYFGTSKNYPTYFYYEGEKFKFGATNALADELVVEDNLLLNQS